MHKTKTWILVADGSRARVLLSEGWGSGLTPVEGKSFEVHIPPTRELGTEKPGRGFSSAHGRPFAVETRTDWHRQAKENFLKSLAEVLKEGAEARAYERLVLVAPPQALGDLRAAIAAKVEKMVIAEVNKDLTHLSLKDLEKQLAEVVPV